MHHMTMDINLIAHSPTSDRVNFNLFGYILSSPDSPLGDQKLFHAAVRLSSSTSPTPCVYSITKEKSQHQVPLVSTTVYVDFHARTLSLFGNDDIQDTIFAFMNAHNIDNQHAGAILDKVCDDSNFQQADEEGDNPLRSCMWAQGSV